LSDKKEEINDEKDNSATNKADETPKDKDEAKSPEK
jgi:hypothetical protein